MKWFLKKTYLIYLFTCLILTIFQRCTPVPSRSLTSLDNFKQLKRQSLQLISLSTDSFSNHSAEINQWKKYYQFVFQLESSRVKNKSILTQLSIISDTNHNSMGGFIKLWQLQHICSKTYIEEKSQQIEKVFDVLIETENNRKN